MFIELLFRLGFYLFGNKRIKKKQMEIQTVPIADSMGPFDEVAVSQAFYLFMDLRFAPYHQKINV